MSAGRVVQPHEYRINKSYTSKTRSTGNRNASMSRIEGDPDNAVAESRLFYRTQ